MSYAFWRAKNRLLTLLSEHGIVLRPEEVRTGDQGVDADLAVPLFRIAKEKNENPVQLAESLAGLELAGTGFTKLEPLRGYLNFTLDRPAFAREVLEDLRLRGKRYGSTEEGSGRTVVVDYSSPNVAKPFSVGHLRSTVIGQALCNILSWVGYRVIGDNHLGDWGTQFGKLLCAFSLWGSEERLQDAPTAHLLELYVRFHEEAEKEPELEEKAREWFCRLEQGETSARTLWRRFVDLSRAEFERIYARLGVSFDYTLGESFYEGRLDGVVERAVQKGVASRDAEGVVLIPLEDYGIKTPLLLRKSDGTSLYATRDIACYEYRLETWQPEKILYVVGAEQELYFQQLNAALRRLGYTVPCVHVSFGLIRLPEGRMSTRKGRVVLLDEVLDEAVRRAKLVLTAREMSEEEKNRVAELVGIAAVKYADLSQSRTKEVVFDWDRMLSLDGDSAPYLLYAHTRCQSILRKAGQNGERFAETDAEGWNPGPEEFAVVRGLAKFPEAVRQAATTYEPHRIANQLFRLAQDFSVFYSKVPVLKAETEQLQRVRLALVWATAMVLKTGLGLLGIGVPERM